MVYKRGAKPRPLRPTPHSYQTKPRSGVCPDCSKKILVSLFDALPVQWDPQPLSLLGELEAHLRGLRTWWLFDTGTYRRRAHSIQESPTGLGGFVHRDHL